MNAKTNTKSNAKTPAGPTASATRQYNAAVKAARSAGQQTDKAAWIIGDAAAKVASLAGYGEKALRTFADEIGQGYSTVANFRGMAERFPATGDVARDLHPVTVYAIFKSQDDAEDLITNGNDGAEWKVGAARKLVQSRKTPKVVNRDALAEKVATLREQLAAAEKALAEYDAKHNQPKAAPKAAPKATRRPANSTKASVADAHAVVSGRRTRISDTVSAAALAASHGRPTTPRTARNRAA